MSGSVDQKQTDAINNIRNYKPTNSTTFTDNIAAINTLLRSTSVDVKTITDANDLAMVYTQINVAKERVQLMMQERMGANDESNMKTLVMAILSFNEFLTKVQRQQYNAKSSVTNILSSSLQVNEVSDVVGENNNNNQPAPLTGPETPEKSTDGKVKTRLFLLFAKILHKIEYIAKPSTRMDVVSLISVSRTRPSADYGENSVVEHLIMLSPTAEYVYVNNLAHTGNKPMASALFLHGDAILGEKQTRVYLDVFYGLSPFSHPKNEGIYVNSVGTARLYEGRDDAEYRIGTYGSLAPTEFEQLYTDELYLVRATTVKGNEQLQYYTTDMLREFLAKRHSLGMLAYEKVILEREPAHSFIETFRFW